MIGFGVQFQRWDATLATPAWVTLALVLDVKPNEKTLGTVEKTTHDSLNKYEEFEAALKSGGELGLTLLWDDTTGNAYDVLDGDFESGIAMNYETMFPDTTNSTFEFLGLVTKVGKTVPLKEEMTCDFTFKITGKPIKSTGAGVIQ